MLPSPRRLTKRGLPRRGFWPAGGTRKGLYAAGVEIDLDPNTVTYWRQPGDAGSPPVFDFSRSVNVASVEVLYPGPKHMDEAGSIVAGYDANVTFPLRVAPRDPKAPVVLDLALDYAACGKICLPARARLSLPFPAGGASPFAGQIAQALALVPKKIAPAEAKSLFALTRREDKPNAWRLTYLGQGKARDLFAEAPEPLFLDSARSADGEGFDLTLVSSCCGAAKPRQSGGRGDAHHRHRRRRVRDAGSAGVTRLLIKNSLPEFIKSALRRNFYIKASVNRKT